MFKKSFTLAMILLLICFIITACDEKNDRYVSVASQGVYKSDFDDIDFNIEISGRLSDSDNLYNDLVYGDNEVVQVLSDGGYSSKLLRWGIVRKPNYQIPDADPGAPELLAEYGGVYLGDTSKKIVYLTFDEGYENGYTEKILDVLRDNNAKAVFFITGPYLKGHQNLVRRMVEEGHIVGNHTIHHPSLPQLDDTQIEEEVLGLDRAFYEKFGKNMKYLRPPKGEYSERTLAITQKLGYCNIFWSFAYDDWYRDKTRGSQYAYDKVMNNLHNGAVILLHAVSRDNAEALDRIIKGIRERGFEIGNVDEIGGNPHD